MTSTSKGKEEKAGYKVYILGNKCYRCGHEWRPRDVDVKPEVCPNCKNPYWYKAKKNNKKKNEKKEK